MSLTGNLSAKNIIIGSIGNIHITDEALQEIVNEITAQLIDNENVRQETFEFNEAQREAEFRANEAARHIIIDQRNIIPDDVEIYTDENGNITPYTLDTKNGEIIKDTAFVNASVLQSFIDVKPNTLYSSATSISSLIEYSGDGTYLRANWTTKKVGNMWQFTTSADCEKIRFSSSNTMLGTKFEYNLCAFEGAYTERPQYQYHTHIDSVLVGEENVDIQAITTEKVKYNAIEEEHCTFIETNKDFLKNASWQAGNVRGYGVFDNDENWYRSNFIAASPSTEYVIGFPVIPYSSVAAFDKNKIPCTVGGQSLYGLLTISSNGKFVTPDDCFYIVVVQHKSYFGKATLHLATANVSETNTFNMPNLKVGISNLGGDVLASVKPSLSSILADLIFATETKKIKLIGDSITHGMGSSDFAQSNDFLFNVGAFPQHRNYGVKCWAGMLKAYLEEKFNCTVTNNGASGSTAQNLIDNWDVIVSPDDDVIICMIGTNDRGKPLATIYQSVVALYEKAQTNNQRIIFMSAPPASIENETQFTACHMEDIDNLYNYVNNTLNVGYISIYKAFLNYCRENDIPIDSLLADGLHPNDTGYQLMFEIVLEALGFGRKRDNATW